MTAGRPARDRRPAADSGTATLWAAGAIAALFLIAGLVFTIGAAVAARHRAAGAADLAALAAAAHAPSGQPDACRKAQWVVERMHARLRRCEISDWIAVVEVSVEPIGLLAPFGSTNAHARAGPADS
jgi:secretion/DNA translocation related TadE-like protein